MERPDFLDQKPPKGYIAGIGRGATGFTTRSDIGSGKVPVRQRGDRERKVGTVPEDEELNDDEDGVLLKNSRFEDPNGLSLAFDNLDKDDEEADNIYNQIDSRLSQRNKKKSELQGSQTLNSENFGSISKDFVDLKRSLADVSEEQWESIPEAGDITRRNKRQRLEMQNERKTYAAPDALLSGNINLTKLTEEREKLLGLQLDENFQTTGNFGNDQATSINNTMEDYLSQLDKSSVNTDIADQVEDLKKMRTIFSSYRKSDPQKPQGWIASARLEERAKKFRLAKQYIEEGCKECPRDEDIWLENIRLNASDVHYCKMLVAEAIQFNSQSLKLWLKAVDLERETFNKVRIIRKALQNLPTSEDLWKLAVQYETDKNEAIKILVKATELIPNSIDLITALINVQNHTEARKTLNRARQNLPTEQQIWILASEVEEKFNAASVNKLCKLLEKGMKDLSKNGKELSMQNWLAEGRNLEQEFASLYPKTVQALIQASINLQYDSSKFPELSHFIDTIEDTCWITKSSIYVCILKREPGRFSLWKKYISLCRSLSRMTEVYLLFDEILFEHNTETLKRYPVLLLMYTKDVWKIEGDVPKALEIINKALQSYPIDVDFWLAKTKLLVVNDMIEEADNVFHDAMKNTCQPEDMERLYYRYISFLRFRGENKKALELLESKCLKEFPQCEKFYLQWGQIYSDLKYFAKSRECYAIGTKKLTNSVNIWEALSLVDEQGLNKSTLARSDLDLALTKNPDSVQLYLGKIRMEARLGNEDQARLLVSEGLRKFPSSAPLWVQKIRLVAKKSLKRTAYQDALKNTNNDAQVLIEIGVNFYRDAQYEKSLKWFQRATSTSPLYGDAWIWLVRCYEKLGRNITPILAQVEENEPRYGEEWINISKNVRTQYLSPSEILMKCL